MATGIGNPLGFVQVLDGGAPRIITGYARETISGGCFVYGSTAADVIGSQTASFADSDIKFCNNATGNIVNGVAVNTATSGAPIAVCTRGVIIALADGTVTAGGPVVVTGVNAVRDISTGSLATTMYPIGRALTTAGSEGFCLVHLNL